MTTADASDDPRSTPPTRRSFVFAGSATATAVALTTAPVIAQTQTAPARGPFWPDAARLPILFSLVWEAGADPPLTIAGTKFPDLPGETKLRYGYLEGLPRLLALFARHGISATAFMCGQSVDTVPALAREIAQRGHECAAHGFTHTPQYQLARDDERAFIASAVDSIVRATGNRPAGYNCRGQQRSTNTLSILQELGFTYHIDDYSRDEPFLVPVNGKLFAVVPYTETLNDVNHFSSRSESNGAFEQALKDEFDVLYAEAEHRRRMMIVSAHDSVGGRPARVAVFERFIAYAQRHPGVWFAKTGDVARWALGSSETIREAVAT